MPEIIEELVAFAPTVTEGQGFLAAPSVSQPLIGGVVVIQEYWGLVGHIKDVCRRYAAEGFVAIAPDLYHGESSSRPDEAGRLMMSLRLKEAAQEVALASRYIANRYGLPGRVAVQGFCMGGGLALMAACEFPADFDACIPFYGVIPWENVQPDWSRLLTPVRGHFALRDEYYPPNVAEELETNLRNIGVDIVIQQYDANHAFFNSDRPEVFDAPASTVAWARTINFLRVLFRP